MVAESTSRECAVAEANKSSDSATGLPPVPSRGASEETAAVHRVNCQAFLAKLQKFELNFTHFVRPTAITSASIRSAWLHHAAFILKANHRVADVMIPLRHSEDESIFGCLIVSIKNFKDFMTDTEVSAAMAGLDARIFPGCEEVFREGVVVAAVAAAGGPDCGEPAIVQKVFLDEGKSTRSKQSIAHRLSCTFDLSCFKDLLPKALIDSLWKIAHGKRIDHKYVEDHVWYGSFGYRWVQLDEEPPGKAGNE